MATIKEKTTIFGKLIALELNTSSVLISLPNRKTIKIKIPDRLINRFLIEKPEIIRLSGIATWDSENIELLSFEVENIMPYKELNFSEIVKKIHSLDPEAWKDISDTSKFIKEIR